MGKYEELLMKCEVEVGNDNLIMYTFDCLNMYNF